MTYGDNLTKMLTGEFETSGEKIFAFYCGCAVAFSIALGWIGHTMNEQPESPETQQIHQTPSND